MEASKDLFTTSADGQHSIVLIVGAGPTGMTAAMELARLDIPVRLIDKPAPDTTSRAIAIQARTLELFKQRRLTDEMLRLGNRGVSASIYGDASGFFASITAHGQPLRLYPLSFPGGNRTHSA